jgi:nucleotidyltransferase/DNA polymerase involved in DNA repair
VARAILHVDMDAFYAAVEQRDRPELKGKPVIVGADPKGGKGRGVVSTASYEARRFGVGSAMPISQAYKLCPHGVYLPVDMAKYAAASDEIMEEMRRYTDLVEPLSIDEAFLDVTGSARAFGDGPTIARELKRSIQERTRLTASVGVSACKLVAKIASDLRKPDGLVIVPPGEEAALLAPLPIRRLWGVGPKLEEQLAKLGILTIGQLAATPRGKLQRRLGTHGQDLLLLARGIDERPVISYGDAKSVGHEHTYDQDTADVERLRRTLLDLADSVARRLRKAGLRGRTITLKYRDETFHTVTRDVTLKQPTDSGDVLFQNAWKLFLSVHGRLKVRLVGVSASGFGDRPQLEMFPRKTSRTDTLRDAVAERFGSEALTRATLLGKRERRHPETADAIPPGVRSRRRTQD